MTANGAPKETALIDLESVSKVFYTDEVETHALEDVTLGIYPGEYVVISGPSGCGKSTLLSILGLLDSPSDGQYHVERPAGGAASSHVGPRPDPEPRDRVHLPELQPDRRPHGLRERRAAADLPRHEAPRSGASG